jgi:hypothetical protein
MYVQEGTVQHFKVDRKTEQYRPLLVKFRTFFLPFTYSFYLTALFFLFIVLIEKKEKTQRASYDRDTQYN